MSSSLQDLGLSYVPFPYSVYSEAPPPLNDQLVTQGGPGGSGYFLWI